MGETILQRATWLMLAVACLSATCGCVSRVEVLTRELESKDPAHRIRAIHAVADERFDELIPVLVNRLDDSDVAVRLYAIVALEKLTGERFGFDYAGPSHLRREAVARWRKFVIERAESESENEVEIQRQIQR